MALNDWQVKVVTELYNLIGRRKERHNLVVALERFGEVDVFE